MSLNLDFSFQRDSFSLQVATQIKTEGVTGIYGPSGCGKTTLLKCIAGLEPVSQGEILFNQQPWTKNKRSLPIEKRSIGFVFQEASLFPHLNIQQNLDYGLSRSRKKAQQFKFDDVVSLLGIGELLHRETAFLSGGEKQRVAIARAILSQPQLLLMDEPMASLDQKSKSEILPCLKKLHKALNLPVIYVSHSAEEIARLADELIIMQKGRVKAHDSLVQLLSDISSPLSEQDQCFVVLDCVVSQINKNFHLASLAFDNQQLKIPMSDFKAGQKVRVSIHAKDVSLCLSPPQDSSILNILPVTIVAMQPDNAGQVLVRLQAGQQFLLARISEYSCQQMSLTDGLNLYAQIKAIALVS